MAGGRREPNMRSCSNREQICAVPKRQYGHPVCPTPGASGTIPTWKTERKQQPQRVSVLVTPSFSTNLAMPISSGFWQPFYLGPCGPLRGAYACLRCLRDRRARTDPPRTGMRGDDKGNRPSTLLANALGRGECWLLGISGVARSSRQLLIALEKGGKGSRHALSRTFPWKWGKES